MKDEKIEQLFDNYADGLPQQNNLAEAARARMSGRSAAKKRPRIWLRLGAVCCALIICVLCVSVVKGTFDNADDQPSYNPSDSAVTYYTAADVVGKRLAATDKIDGVTLSTLFAADKLQQRLGANSVVSAQKYVAYYLADGTLACVKSVYRVYVDGNFVDVEVLAENKGFVDERHADVYRYFSANADKISYNYVNGEVVSQAYVAAQNFRFYVTAFNPDVSVSITVCQTLRSIL